MIKIYTTQGIIEPYSIIHLDIITLIYSNGKESKSILCEIIEYIEIENNPSYIIQISLEQIINFWYHCNNFVDFILKAKVSLTENGKIYTYRNIEYNDKENIIKIKPNYRLTE